MISPSSGESPVDFLLVTTHDEDLNALLEALPTKTRRISSPGLSGSYYECDVPVPQPNDGGESSYRIVVAQSSMGRVHAGVATSTAIHQWHPRFVLLIGLAGGVARKEIQIGDILIADQIVDYEEQKLTADGAQRRWGVYQVDPVLLDAARHTARGKWTSRIKGKTLNRKQIRCHFGPIASGDKIIASHTALESLLEHWPRLIGLEMEGTGVAAAVRQASPAPGFLMIRSVADFADGSKTMHDRVGAVATVAAFTVAFIRDGGIPSRTSSFDFQVVPPHPIDQDTPPEKATTKPAEDARSDATGPTPFVESAPALLIQPQLAGFTADKPNGEDLLDVQPDANALASLIAARTTPPPLSIGLFGHWGSGKTFFMQQVRQRVTEITDAARTSDRMQKDIAYYKHTIQIEFNAWHYVEGNLWASLVEHILRKLLTLGTTPNVLQVLHSEIVAKIAVETHLQDDLKQQMEATSEEIEEIVGTIKKRTEDLADAAEEIQKVNARNILAALTEEDEVRRELQKLTSLIHLKPAESSIERKNPCRISLSGGRMGGV